MCYAGKTNFLVDNESTIGRIQLDGYRRSQRIIFGQYNPAMIYTIVVWIIIPITNIVAGECEMPHVPLLSGDWTNPDM